LLPHTQNCGLGLYVRAVLCNKVDFISLLSSLAADSMNNNTTNCNIAQSYNGQVRINQAHSSDRPTSLSKTTRSAVAMIADRTACESSRKLTFLPSKFTWRPKK